MTTFQIHRARIPNSRFHLIIDDIRILANQYGLPRDHENVEAWSRFIAGASTRIVSWFELFIVNVPGSVMEGRLTTPGRVEYLYKCFSACSILFIEVKLELGTATERLDAIAQVIAESDTCDFANLQNEISIPVLGVLCDGQMFEFFSFDRRSGKAVVSRGMVIVQPAAPQPLTSVQLPHLEDGFAGDYVKALHPLCEILFSLFLTGFVNGLKGFLSKSEADAKRDNRLRESTPQWYAALAMAEESLTLAKAAAGVGADMSSDDKIVEADLLAEQALQKLSESLDKAPVAYRRKVDFGVDWTRPEFGR